MRLSIFSCFITTIITIGLQVQAAECEFLGSYPIYKKIGEDIIFNKMEKASLPEVFTTNSPTISSVYIKISNKLTLPQPSLEISWTNGQNKTQKHSYSVKRIDNQYLRGDLNFAIKYLSKIEGFEGQFKFKFKTKNTVYCSHLMKLGSED